MKITFFEVEPWQKEYLKKKLKGHQLRFVSDELTLKNLSKAKNSEAIVVFIYSVIDKEILDKLSNLKFIYTMSTGFNHIDINACKQKGIKVFNVPSYGENTVAEHTIGLMLSLSKKIPQSVMNTKKGNFDLDGLEGFDLKGKTLGVIGCGNIGQQVIKIAKAMEMNVIVMNRSQNEKLAKELGFRYVSLKELLSKSEIITLHVPLTPETKHMINMKNISLVKKGAYLINTARGGLIETKALISALDKGIIAGVALDVLEEEEDLKEDRHLSKRKLSAYENKIMKQNLKLLKDRDVLITPHSAFYTREAQQRILDVTVENIFGKGKAIV